MNEHEREKLTQTGGEDQEERAGGDAQTKGGDDSGCATEYEERPGDASRGHTGETLAGDPTKLGKP